MGKNIIVWWHDKAQASKPTSYTGKIVAFRENDADQHEVHYDDGDRDYLQLETLHVRHSRGDEETTCRVMWMLQRPDLDAETLSKQLELDKFKTIHKRKAEVKQIRRGKKRKTHQKKHKKDEDEDDDEDEDEDKDEDEDEDEDEDSEKKKKKQIQMQKRKKKKKEDDEYEEDENNLSDDEASESDEDEQLNTKKIAKADIAAQAQPQSRYPTKRNRKQNVQINVDHPKYRTGWGASDTQKKKAAVR